MRLGAASAARAIRPVARSSAPPLSSALVVLASRRPVRPDPPRTPTEARTSLPPSTGSSAYRTSIDIGPAAVSSRLVGVGRVDLHLKAHSPAGKRAANTRDATGLEAASVELFNLERDWRPAADLVGVCQHPEHLLAGRLDDRLCRELSHAVTLASDPRTSITLRADPGTPLKDDSDRAASSLRTTPFGELNFRGGARSGRPMASPDVSSSCNGRRATAIYLAAGFPSGPMTWR